MIARDNSVGILKVVANDCCRHETRSVPSVRGVPPRVLVSGRRSAGILEGPRKLLTTLVFPVMLTRNPKFMTPRIRTI